MAGVFPCEGWRVLKLLLLFWPLDTRVLARSGESTVHAAKDKDDVLTNHAQTIFHHDGFICTITHTSRHSNRCCARPGAIRS